MRLLPILLIAAAPVLAGDREPVAYVVVDGAGAPDPLTAVPGDAALGAEIAARNGCLGCHDGATAAGPSALAATPTARARLAIIDLSVLDPDAAGHAYYDIAPDPLAERVAETRLTAQEVEDVLAWLGAQVGP
jgi:hypothetical protein